MKIFSPILKNTRNLKITQNEKGETRSSGQHIYEHQHWKYMEKSEMFTGILDNPLHFIYIILSTAVENKNCLQQLYSKSSFVLSASRNPCGAWETSDWNSRIRWMRSVKTSDGSVCWSTWSSWVGWPQTMTALERCSTPFVMSPCEINAGRNENFLVEEIRYGNRYVPHLRPSEFHARSSAARILSNHQWTCIE